MRCVSDPAETPNSTPELLTASSVGLDLGQLVAAAAGAASDMTNLPGPILIHSLLGMTQLCSSMSAYCQTSVNCHLGYMDQ